ncbi:hypothetical protein GCM10010116_16250 [Microbispora rosea subsp. aerata]|nr:hypothetical protein GCM10010116_16250 [Microbispora rosea subsp. aerata]GIH53323.1 hypothetical protein Mro02_02370 [Microbispora rosea subsp. aerata]GLJ83762.1 hypothetical protein GCM10017588_24900 [Microbispora rosea subsp. aerata]
MERPGKALGAPRRRAGTRPGPAAGADRRKVVPFAPPLRAGRGPSPSPAIAGLGDGGGRRARTGPLAVLPAPRRRHGNLENPRDFGHRLAVMSRAGPEKRFPPPVNGRNHRGATMRKEIGHGCKGTVGPGKPSRNRAGAMCFLFRQAGVCILLGDGVLLPPLA